MKKDIILKDWLVLAQLTDFKIQKFSRPRYVRYHVAGWRSWWPFRLFLRQWRSKETPQSLNDLTMGQLIRLGNISEQNEPFTICEIMLGLSHDEIASARATDVIRLCGWVMDEAEKISDLFNKANTRPTSDERKAGIDNLRFGLFGMLDWYAQRMHIQDQEQVANVSWMKIYKCIDMDNKKNEFNKRYQEVLNDEYRRKNKVNR